MIKTIESNLSGQPRFTFGGKLLSISDTVLQNSNQKNYRLANVEYTNNNGEIKQCSVAIYEGNYSKGVDVGKEYLCTATVVTDATTGKSVVYVQMSHLTIGAGFADVSDFVTANAVQGATVAPSAIPQS